MMTRRIHREQPAEWAGHHLLKCTHSLNSNSKIHYLMYCNILKDMPQNRKKVLVFGYRHRSIEGRKIRYVDGCQLAPASKYGIKKETEE